MEFLSEKKEVLSRKRRFQHWWPNSGRGSVDGGDGGNGLRYIARGERKSNKEAQDINLIVWCALNSDQQTPFAR